MNRAPLSVITRPDQASALMQPERLRLLEALGEPDSAAGLARRFDLPRQRLNYHLKELERVGLLELVEERRKGNCVERVVRATARAYAISPEILGGLGRTREQVTDRLSATYLVSVASRAIREVGALLGRATAAGKRVATLTIDTEIRFAGAAARAAWADELTDAIARLTAKYHAADAPAGRTFRLVAAAYPRPADSPESDHPAKEDAQ
jgi:DNA-binding transcriptional ArsR family regulator